MIINWCLIQFLKFFIVISYFLLPRKFSFFSIELIFKFEAKIRGSADGASNVLHSCVKCSKTTCLPTFISGDFDSITPDVKNFYASKVSKFQMFLDDCTQRLCAVNCFSPINTEGTNSKLATSYRHRLKLVIILFPFPCRELKLYTPPIKTRPTLRNAWEFFTTKPNLRTSR